MGSFLYNVPYNWIPCLRVKKEVLIFDFVDKFVLVVIAK